MDSTVLLSEVTTTLSSIIGFWTENMADPRGGYYGRMDGFGNIQKDAPRGVVINARILWALSAAYRVTKNPGYKLAAVRQKDWFIQHFIDNKYGGVYWSTDADGNRLDTHKQAYAQGFAIYALSEYVRATMDTSALPFAQSIYKEIERNLSDKVNGGYIEAASRDWSTIEDMRLSEKEDNWAKSFNTHLHILEPYTNLYRVWPDEGLKSGIAAILDIFSDRIWNSATGHLNLFFDMQWNSSDYGCSYGHEVEAAWLMLEAAFLTKDIDIINKTRRYARLAYEAGSEGLQSDGSLINEKHADGSLDTDRIWWVQAENVVANIWMWKYYNDTRAAERALRQWEYISTRLIDPCGEWRWKVNADGQPDMQDELAGTWKCPYHNARMCIEVLEQLNQ